MTNDETWTFGDPADFTPLSHAPHEATIGAIIRNAVDVHPAVPIGDGFTLKMSVGALAQRIARAVEQERRAVDAAIRAQVARVVSR